MKARAKRPAPKRARARTRRPAPAASVASISARELRALGRQIEKRRSVARWNPDADDVQRSVVQLVLTLVELIRRLMEKQAIRRMRRKTFTKQEAESVGRALMEIERTILQIARQFDLTPEDLNLDLGAIRLL